MFDFDYSFFAEVLVGGLLSGVMYSLVFLLNFLILLFFFAVIQSMIKLSIPRYFQFFDTKHL